MKYAGINRRYTAIVAEYMSRGYTINTATMRGSQGEVCKIDLTDGKEIIRIMVERFTDRIGRAHLIELVGGLEIIIGRNRDDVEPNSNDTWATVWDHHLELIHRERFYDVTGFMDGYYGTLEEVVRINDIRRQRLANDRTECIIDLTHKLPQAKEIGKSILKKKYGYKKINSKDVSVFKEISKGKSEYYAVYRGKTYNLK